MPWGSNYSLIFDADNQPKDIIAIHRGIRGGAVVSLGDIELRARNLPNDTVRNKCIPRLQQNYVTQAGRAYTGLYGYFSGRSQGITHAPALDAKRHIPAAFEIQLNQLFGDFCRRAFAC